MIEQLNYTHNVKNKVNEVVDEVNISVKQVDTIADLQGLTGVAGQQVSVASYHGLDDLSGGGTFVWGTGRHNGGTFIDPSRASPTDWTDQVQIEDWFADSGINVGGWERAENNHITVEMYGALPILDLSPFVVQASKNNSVVNLDGATTYKLDTLAVIPAKTIINFNFARVNINSTDYGFVMGESGDTLQYRIKLLDMLLIAANKTVTVIWSRANSRCEATGYIEGPLFGGAEDATRTNIGLWIDGANVSSFFNEWNIQFNHVHESVRVATSGTVFATAQTFINCNVFGDSTTDPLAKGFNFGNGNGKPEAQGSVVIGGNIEKQGIGIDVSNFAGPIAIVGTRFEEGSNVVDVWYRGNNPAPSSISGCGSHVNVVWDNTALAGTVFFGPDGSLGRPDGGQKYNSRMKLLMSPTTNSFDITTPETSTGTGRIALQAGGGSATWGGGFAAFAAAHASYAGDSIATVSGSGVFGVGVGYAGSSGRIFKVSTTEITAARDNVAKLGSATERYTEVFAVNGTINTSDEREKTEILPIDDKLKTVALEIKSKIGIYQWLSSVEEKGTDNARWHFGVGAQTVKATFEKHGLDGFKYGCLCYDEWDETPEVTNEVPVFNNDVQVFDENGEPVYETVISEVYRPAGNRFGVRVDQLLMLMLSAL